MKIHGYDPVAEQSHCGRFVESWGYGSKVDCLTCIKLMPDDERQDMEKGVTIHAAEAGLGYVADTDDSVETDTSHLIRDGDELVVAPYEYFYRLRRVQDMDTYTGEIRPVIEVTVFRPTGESIRTVKLGNRRNATGWIGDNIIRFDGPRRRWWKENGRTYRRPSALSNPNVNRYNAPATRTEIEALAVHFNSR